MTGLFKGLQPYSPKWKNHGTGGGTSFTLDVPSTTNATLLTIGGVLQLAGTDYTVSGTTVTTTSSVASGVEVISAVLYDLGSVTTPGAGTVNFDALSFTSQAQGDILYRAGSSWARLPAGTSGQFLKTQGTGANPQWATVSSDFVKINSSTASGASVDFTSSHFDNSTYSSYVFKFLNIKPGTDGQHLCCRTSADGGSNYDSSGYDRVVEERSSAGNEQQNGGDAQSEVRLTSDNNWGSAANESLSGTLNLYNPGASEYTHMNFTMAYMDDQAGTYWNSLHGSGQRTSAAAVTGIQFFPSSGTLSAGTIIMYGVK